MGKIFFVRHGQASLFADNYDQLSDKGYQQALALGRYFKEENIFFDNAFLGPLQRHHQTLESILSVSDHYFCEVKEMEGLKEHQGYKILKSLLPQLIQEDAQIQKIISEDPTSRKEKIRQHMRVYENFSLRWAAGEFDHLTNGHQSWNEFIKAASSATKQIKKSMNKGQHILVVTSGGPKAVAFGMALGLSPKKIMDTTMVIYNCSISEFFHQKERFTLSSFNNISHLRAKELRTLV